MRRLGSYQKQLPWQVVFFKFFYLFFLFLCQAVYFAGTPSTERYPESLHPLSASSAHWQTLESGCDASPDLDINHPRNSPDRLRQVSRIFLPGKEIPSLPP
jgi:hypothetical protein